MKIDSPNLTAKLEDVEQYPYLKGARISNGSLSILAKMMVVLGGEELESVLITLSRNMEAYLTGGNSQDLESCLKTKIFQINTPLDFNKYPEFQPEHDTCYKYLSKESLQYLKDDRFQLGTLDLYQRSVGNDNDRMEGFTHFYSNELGGQRIQVFYSGFNYLIFCGSYISPDRPEAPNLKANFGPCVIRIKDTKKFIDIVSGHLKAKSVLYKKVSYQPLKIIRTQFDEKIDDVAKGIYPPEIFELIHSIAKVPSIFMKNSQCYRNDVPYLYSNEYEVRIAFEMEKDQSGYVHLNNLGLV